LGKAYTKTVEKIKIIKVMATTNCGTQIKSKSASASVREMDLGKPRKAVRERIPHKNWEK